MNNYERLTEWRNGHGAIVNNRENYIDKLARYEDAEEQGRIVVLPEPTPDIDFMQIFNLAMADAEDRAFVLPCKVGDMVYYRKGQYIYGDDVKRIVLDGLDNQVIVDANHCYTFSDFGVKVFLSREEAEKALEGTK